MKKQLLLLALTLFCLTGTHFAQSSNHYLLKTGMDTYTELTNDTVVTGAYANPTGTWIFELVGDNFNLFDKTYTIDNVKTYIEFSNNGFMRVQDDTSFIVVDAMFTQVDSIDNTTALSYVVEGAQGSKILKVQWKNLALKNGQPGNYVNYQIWLHQLTGIFEIHYGSSSASNNSGFTTANGPNIGLFYAPKSFTQMFEKIWVNGAPGSYTLDSARTVSFSAVSGVPPNGTVLRYIPKKAAVSIPAIKDAYIEVYPNPADERINIRLEAPLTEPAKIRLYDISGREVHTYDAKTNTRLLSIPVDSIAEGVYELKLVSKEHAVTQKVEIRRK